MTFTRQHLTRAARVTLAAVTSAVALCNAWAQRTPDYRYSHLARFKEEARYEASGVLVYPRESFPAKVYDVRPHQLLRQLFPSAVAGDGNNKATSDGLWRALLNSGYVMGSATRLTRAQDLLEDWDINFVAPQTPDRNHWFDWYGDNYAAGTSVGYGKVLLDGPQKGARTMGNGNLLAMGDDRTMWLDADGSLSFYWRGTGTLEFDSSRVTYLGWDLGPVIGFFPR